ncbi:MAG: tRNA (adenosine(37)-N6)-dimethylallyltransferase MiaA [Polaribacter sp.]
MSKQRNFLIVVLGPTAIGKTALSIKIANYYNSDILSADSRQFYNEMQVGTAVPEPEELEAANHHFIQNRSIFENYNVGDFEVDALNCLHTLFEKHHIQVMVGGSGLYLNAVVNGLDNFPKVDGKIRDELNARLASEGLESLQNQLKELDELSYHDIAIDNPQRLIRALEICIGTNQPYSSFKTNSKKERDFETIKIGLTADRDILYDRINRRVDVMIQNGLLEEAKALLPHKNLNALQTVGYRELFAYFEGNTDKDFAVSEIKKNTRRFAKRQLTWFRKDQDINWFDFETPFDEISALIDSKINAF